MELRAQKIGLFTIVLFLGVILVASGLFIYRNFVISSSTITLITPKTSINAKTAKTSNEREIGLSGTEKLDDKSGMIFYFEESSADNCFWMKDTLIPLDMVFLDDNKKIVTVYENVTPDSYPTEFCPNTDAKYGLEINAGMASEFGLITGSTVHFE